MLPDGQAVVAVVGAGFSGLLAAVRLLERDDGPQVRLIERGRRFGLGAAYATPSDEHLLNVRAANMSAFPAEPGHFAEWLSLKGEADAADLFVRRSRYGEYLQAMLRAVAEHTEPGRLILEADSAVGLSRAGEGWRVRLAMGRTLAVDAVVLAVGNLPPHAPETFDDDALASPAYCADPWGGKRDLPREGLALLMGSGLTMVDVALRTSIERPRLRMLALSRRGLLPRRHLEVGPDPVAWTPKGGPVEVLRQVRARAGGGDWRPAVDGMRPYVQALWRGWSAADRGRFLRHARPWWDVHRHRVAPATASKLDHLTAAGRLTFAAGRLVSVTGDEAGFDVRWRPRHAHDPQPLRVDAIVNCTGPNGDLARADDPLLADLASQGLVRADACGLGLEVDARSRLVGRDGRAHPTLFGIGPVTRGAFWEITSVPDIRVQTAECAPQVCAALARTEAAVA